MHKVLKTILLVDDDEVTNYINAENLRALNVAKTINICNDGKEGLSYLQNALAKIGDASKAGEVPNLIFLDINMPEMDGFEFLEAYSKLENPDLDEVVIVMLSTSLREEDVNRAQLFSSIVYDYIEKPLTQEVALHVMGKYFQLSPTNNG